MVKKLLKKYKEQEERMMFYLKSKYSTEKIEKLEKVARKVCSFLIFLNVCTLMLNVQAVTKGIEEAIKEEASTLTVVLSDEKDDQDKIHESQAEVVKTENIDHFSQEVENLNSDNSMEITKENLYVTKRLIVMANSSEFNPYGAKNVINFDNLYILQYETEEQTKDAYEQLESDNQVESVEIDTVMEAENLAEGSEDTKNTLEDTELKKYLDKLQAVEEIKTAVLDTGLNSSSLIEPDRIIDSKVNLAITGEKNSTADDNGHGTEMAELIAKNSNSNVKIMPIKVANSQGKATILNVYLGIQKAIENDAKVINISMNTVVSTQSQILSKAISEASEKGILFIVSAGNDNEDVRNYTPSNINSAIVVSAVEEDNNFASYSNYGQTIDYATYGTYKGKTGTSYSAATVTGIMADMLSKNQEVSGVDSYAIDLGENGFDSYFGRGFIGLQFKGTSDNSSENNNDNNNENTGNNENDNNGENMDNENNNKEENNKPEDEIPPDYFENRIFGAPWKTLSDEEVKEKLKRAQKIPTAIFLQHLSEEDLELILSKDTILQGSYVTYEYAKDENGNYIWDDNKEDYKIEETSMTYYKHLLEIDMSELSTSVSEFLVLNGQYYVNLIGDYNYYVTIQVEVAAYTANKAHTVKCSAVFPPGVTNHYNFQLSPTQPKTQVGATNNQPSNRYDVFVIQASYVKPAYTYSIGIPHPVSSKRMNFKEYNWQDSGVSTVDNKIYNYDVVDSITMCVNSENMGLDVIDKLDDGLLHYCTMDININHPTLSISYNSNGGEPKSISRVDSMAYNNQGTLPTFATLGLTRTGYIPKNGAEWKIENKEYGQNTSNAAYTYKSFTNGLYWTSQSTTAVANWVPITYTVTYNGNGATGGSTADSSHTYDTEKALTTNGYTRAYTVTYDYNGNGQSSNSSTATYTFDGWSDGLASGPGQSPQRFEDEEIVKNLTTTNGGTVTLYAKWTSTSVTLPTPTREGYIFQGWYDTQTGGIKIGNGGSSYTPTSNKKLYAHWTPITYTVTYNGNGATEGRTANSSHTYDVGKALTKNGYKRNYMVTYNYNGSGQASNSTTANYIFNRLVNNKYRCSGAHR